MKNYKIRYAPIIVLLCLLALVALKSNEPATEWEPVVDYVQNATVVALEGSEADLVVCETEDGNLWEFYSDEWAVGDTIVLFMLDNDTPETIYDDVIYDVI